MACARNRLTSLRLGAGPLAAVDAAQNELDLRAVAAVRSRKQPEAERLGLLECCHSEAVECK